jgi:hypothetical protein
MELTDPPLVRAEDAIHVVSSLQTARYDVVGVLAQLLCHREGEAFAAADAACLALNPGVE